MKVLELRADGVRELGEPPGQVPEGSFIWVWLERSEFAERLPELQVAADRLGGAQLLELHVQDLAGEAQPSNYDGTSFYDLVVFRRLTETVRLDPQGREASAGIDSCAVGFVVFDKLLISVHGPGAPVALHAMVQLAVDAPAPAGNGGARAVARLRMPRSPVELALRMIGAIVDGYLGLRRELAALLEGSQQALLRPRLGARVWSNLMWAREQLHLLQDLCEDQQDTMQEWLQALREQPPEFLAMDAAQARRRQDGLMARARDVIEHIDRILGHARRLEQSAETAVQLHFNAQGQRTNDIMLTLTVITAVFLPLNLFTGFFGMNFDDLPLIHTRAGLWIALLVMLVPMALLGWLFWRRHLFGAAVAPRRIAPADVRRQAE